MLTPALAEMPDPTAALVLIRVLLQAHLSTIPKKRAEALLKRVSELLATEEAVAAHIPVRAGFDRRAVAQARREAIVLFGEMLPAWVAAVSGE